MTFSHLELILLTQAVFAATLKQAYPLFTPFPSDVIATLASRPERVRQKAYLVIYYGVMLTMTSSTPDLFSEEIQAKLRWNLWLSLNDAKLLLEPSDINIEALL